MKVALYVRMLSVIFCQILFVRYIYNNYFKVELERMINFRARPNLYSSSRNIRNLWLTKLRPTASSACTTPASRTSTSASTCRPSRRPEPSRTPDLLRPARCGSPTRTATTSLKRRSETNSCFRWKWRPEKFTADSRETASPGPSTTTTRKPSTLWRTRTGVQRIRTFSGNGSTTVRRESSRPRSTPSSSPTATPSSSSVTSESASVSANPRTALVEMHSAERRENRNTKSKDPSTLDNSEKKFR